MLTPEARFRRFARAVTTEVGALDSSFLGRGRPLGAARVLNAVGQGLTDVADIRAYLRLDSGLMSRLLRALEDEGLVVIRPDPADARRRSVELTAAGRREFDAYEDLSDGRAARVLASHRDPEALLAALDLIASSLAPDLVEIRRVDPREPAARWCLDRYYGELQRVFEDGFDVAKSRDPQPDKLLPPRGAFLVAIQDGLPIGCVGLSGNGGEVAEIKRLWVAPCARGLGCARRLMAAVEDEARELGVRTLRLDTNRALPEAAELYRRSGWREIERFNDDPYAHVFFEKLLKPIGSR
jgi:DNA-binding MarR family transcriptional regulator/GNAT superfamily N-acetyltransferase